MPDASPSKTVRRRLPGEGTIRWREDLGVYEARVDVGRSPDGKRRRKSLYAKTLKAIREKLKEAKGSAPGALSPAKMTVADLFAAWVAHMVAAGRKAATVAQHRSLVEKHALPVVGGVRLTRLSRTALTMLFADLRENAAPSIPRAVFVSTRVMFRWAVAQGYLGTDPMAGVPRPAASTAEEPSEATVRVWTEAEVEAFLAAARGSEWFAVFALALGCGLRRGEIFGLRWGDVDLERQRVTVRRALSEVAGRFRLQEPKTKAGRRTVSLPSWVGEALEVHGVRDRDELVFSDARGGFVRRSNFDRRVLRPLVAEAGVPARTLHELRHCHASIALSRGVNVRVLSARLGHANVSITLQTYSHLMPQDDEAAADAFEGFGVRDG